MVFEIEIRSKDQGIDSASTLPEVSWIFLILVLCCSTVFLWSV